MLNDILVNKYSTNRHSADAAHSINASMAAVPPGPFSDSFDSPLCPHDIPPEKQPLRSLAARRDEAALKFLRIDDQIKKLHKERYTILDQIQGEFAKYNCQIDLI